MNIYEDHNLAGFMLGLLLKAASGGPVSSSFAILAGTGAPSGATYGGQTLETNQKALALRADAPSADEEFYGTLNGGTTWTALKILASAWYPDSVTPAAWSAAGVHAGVAGTAANAFPGPFTNPDVPRSVDLVFGNGWDGGNVLLTGTSGLGVAQTETITSPGAGGGTVSSVKTWATITAASKTSIGANPATVSIGRGNKIGVSKAITAVGGIVTLDEVSETVLWDRTNSAFTPTTPPNGSRVYRYAVIG